MNSFFITLSALFKRWFHKRNIIIISERKVKHIPISGHIQFCALLLLLGGVCWASYSTGSFIAARSALKEQGQALRSVTNARIETSFNSVYQPQIQDISVDIGPYKNNPALSSASPMAALSAMDNAKLMARITLLENKVLELRNTNDAIVQRVHDKTSGRMDDLESIIKQTGLNINDLKKQYSDVTEKPKQRNHAARPSEGGPYIPDEAIPPQAKEMLNDLDQLAVLNKIVGNLPLSKPLVSYEEQSPFGRRIDPINGHLAFHSGLDMSGPAGSKVRSTADGKVISASRNGAYGNAVDIDHGFGIVTRYAHMSEILAHEGQTVRKGEVIGIQGSTGRSTGPHVHYEVRYHDRPMNPKNFLEAGAHVSTE